MKPSEKSASLDVLFMGTNCLLVGDGKTHLLIDPHFTRPGKLALVGKIAPDEAKVREGLQRAGVLGAERPGVAAVLLTHTHYDHVLDAPTAARLTGALLVGSRSAVVLGRAEGLPEAHLVEMGDGSALAFGNFQVSFHGSRHMVFPLVHSLLVKEGGIEAPLSLPLRSLEYQEGGTYAILLAHPVGNVLILGSANYTPEVLRDVQAGTIVLGIGGLGLKSKSSRESLVRGLSELTGARRIFLSHWDDFTRALDRPPVHLIGGRRVLRDFHRERGIEFQLLPWWEWITL